MKTTTERWEMEYQVKKDLEEQKSIRDKERDRDYYGYLCDREVCIESGVREG